MTRTEKSLGRSRKKETAKAGTAGECHGEIGVGSWKGIEREIFKVRGPGGYQRGQLNTNGLTAGTVKSLRGFKISRSILHIV